MLGFAISDHYYSRTTVPRYLPGALCRTDDQVAPIVAVNGTHRLPDALELLMCGLGPKETARRCSANASTTAAKRLPRAVTACSRSIDERVLPADDDLPGNIGTQGGCADRARTCLCSEPGGVL